MNCITGLYAVSPKMTMHCLLHRLDKVIIAVCSTEHTSNSKLSVLVIRNQDPGLQSFLQVNDPLTLTAEISKLFIYCYTNNNYKKIKLANLFGLY